MQLLCAVLAPLLVQHWTDLCLKCRNMLPCLVQELAALNQAVASAVEKKNLQLAAAAAVGKQGDTDAGEKEWDRFSLSRQLSTFLLCLSSLWC